MYAEVKTGHLYPTVLKIRLQWAPLHTATSHLLPCSQRRRRWFPQGSTAPTAPKLSHRVALQCNDTKWGEHQCAQLLAACLLLPQRHSCPAVLTEKGRLPSSRWPGLPLENPEGLRAYAIRKAKQQHPVRGIARPCSSLLPFLLQKDEHSSLRTVLLSSFCLWPHEALLTRAPIESHYKNRDQHEAWSRGACFHIILSVKIVCDYLCLFKKWSYFSDWKKLETSSRTLMLSSSSWRHIILWVSKANIPL